MIFYSTDLDEVLEVSGRIAVIYGGKIVSILKRGDADLYRSM